MTMKYMFIDRGEPEELETKPRPHGLQAFVLPNTRHILTWEAPSDQVGRLESHCVPRATSHVAVDFGAWREFSLRLAVAKDLLGRRIPFDEGGGLREATQAEGEAAHAREGVNRLQGPIDFAHREVVLLFLVNVFRRRALVFLHYWVHPEEATATAARASKRREQA